MRGMNLRDVADPGYGGLASGIASGIQSGVTMLQNERRLSIEEDAKKALTLDRQLKIVDALDQYPDKAPMIADMASKYGIDIKPFLQDTGTGVDPEKALLKLQQGGLAGLSDDEQKALVRGARRDKSGVFRTTVTKALETMRTDRETGDFMKAVDEHQAKNPGASWEDAAAAVARTSPSNLRAYAGDKGGVKATAQPQLAPKDRLTEDARPKISDVLARLDRGDIDAGAAERELLALPGGREAIAASAVLSARANRMKSMGTKVGEADALNAPVAGGALNLADIGQPSTTVAPGAPPARRGLMAPGEEPFSFGNFRPQLEGAGIQNLGDVVSGAPPRTVGDVKADQVTREKLAKETDLERRRVAAAERNAASGDVRAGAAVQSAATGAAREKRLADFQTKAETQIKTLEAQGIAIARKTFPDDPVAQRALAERLNNRLKGLGQLVNQDKDAATIQQEIEAEIAKIKGEIDATPEGPAKSGASTWWESIKGFGRGVFGGGETPPSAPTTAAPAPAGTPARPMPGRGKPPAPATAAPAPPQDALALKAARDKAVEGAFPGRTWADLTPQEKQQVAARLNGAP